MRCHDLSTKKPADFSRVWYHRDKSGSLWMSITRDSSIYRYIGKLGSVCMLTGSDSIMQRLASLCATLTKSRKCLNMGLHSHIPAFLRFRGNIRYQMRQYGAMIPIKNEIRENMGMGAIYSHECSFFQKYESQLSYIEKNRNPWECNDQPLQISVRKRR